MAEDLENTQKPKAELIKHAQNERESSAGGAAPEHGERRKVIVVKKKPPQTSSASASGGVKKPQPRVVVASHPEAARAAEVPAKQKAQNPPEDPVSREAAPQQAPEARDLPPDPQKANPPGAEPAPGTVPPEAAAEIKSGVQEENKQEGRNGNQVMSFPTAQRPAAAAGRVGGKPVGRSRDENARFNSPPPFPGRPAGAAGRVGGRLVGPRQDAGGGRPGFGAGPAGPRPGGGRPGFGPGPAGPRPGGGRPGFGAGPAGPRPGGGRPGFGTGPAGPRPGGGRPGFGTGPAGSRPGGGRPGGNRGEGAPASGSLVEGKTPAKRSFKAKKPIYTRKEKELEMEEKLLQTKKKITHVANPIPKSIEIMEAVSVSELARKMNLKVSDLIQKLMSMGMMVTINQQIDADTAAILAGEYGADVKIISLYDETQIETVSDEGAEM
ncbi:MAG: translation initiation factor IF-2 N-terminal domain-containing protein, partial [Treponema sp.]|nr:translation initiation factor IF-2 N-terminal domain-containing protein [Treponema sp.]